MGEAKRRKNSDPNYGKNPVRVKVEKSSLTGKWLVVAYILGERIVISPHYKKDDADAASQQVFQRFNTLSIDEWRSYRAGDSTPLKKAFSLLDYDDDDEIIGVVRGDLPTVDGNVVFDCTSETIERATKEANQRAIEKTGRTLFTPAPGSWIKSENNDQ